MKALQEYQKKLLEHKVQIYVRRGGPNYQEGLRVMREVGKKSTWVWFKVWVYEQPDRFIPACKCLLLSQGRNHDHNCMDCATLRLSAQD